MTKTSVQTLTISQLEAVTGGDLSIEITPKGQRAIGRGVKFIGAVAALGYVRDAFCDVKDRNHSFMGRLICDGRRPPEH